MGVSELKDDPSSMAHAPRFEQYPYRAGYQTHLPYRLFGKQTGSKRMSTMPKTLMKGPLLLLDPVLFIDESAALQDFVV